MRRENGSVTVFLILVFTLIFALVLSSVEAARSAGTRAFSRLLLKSAADSLMSDYYRPLFDEYGLFAIDTGFGTKKSDTFEMAGRLEAYVNDNIRKIEPEWCRIDSVEPLLTVNGQEFISQAVEFEKGALVEDLLEMLLERIGVLGAQNELSGILKKRLAVEEKLSVIDRYTLELMELIDGARCGLSSFEVTDGFVKSFCPGGASAAKTGINNPAVYSALADKYRDPLAMSAALAAEMTAYAAALREVSAAAEEVSRLRAETDENEALAAAEAMLAEKQAGAAELGTACESRAGELTELCSRTKTAIESALETLDRLEVQQKVLKPAVEAFETAVGVYEKVTGSSAPEGITDSIELMRSYVGLAGVGDNLDYSAMRATLEKDLDVLNRLDGSFTMPASDPPQLEAAAQRVLAAQDITDEFSFEELSFDYSGIKENPVGEEIEKCFKNVLADGFLGLVLDDTSGLSDSEVETALLPSAWLELGDQAYDDSRADGLAGGISRDGSTGFYGEAEEGSALAGIGRFLKGAAGEISDKLLSAAYVQNRFSNYLNCTGSEETVLKYEQEYILCGHETDKANLAAAIGRILLLRLVISGIYVFTDSNTKAQAAAAVAGLSEIPMLAAALKYLILAVWSFEQAIIETAAILRGKKVPVVTGSDSFCVRFIELFTFSPTMVGHKADNFRESELYLTYDNYLFIFLLLKTDAGLAGGALDVIQENIRYAYDEDFLIYNCVTGFEATAQMTCPSKYTGLLSGLLPGAADIKGYSVKETVRVCY